VIIAGDGPERDVIAEAAARSTKDIRLVGWVDQSAATAWLAHASLLLFPSRGPESLSRVLLEASALGVPIAAMNTGGTPDIVLDRQTGLLSSSFDGLADDIRRLRDDADLRRQVGAAARAHAEMQFDSSVVLPRVERLYQELVQRRA